MHWDKAMKLHALADCNENKCTVFGRDNKNRCIDWDATMRIDALGGGFENRCIRR
jgi:hypothetical protein